MTVVVLTQWFDPTADHVIAELNARGVPVFRFDLADFPERLTMAAELAEDGWAGSLKARDRELCLGDVTGLYYRRPTDFEFPQQMSQAERRWAEAEARMGLGGVLSALNRWLNHPSSVAAAEFKPVQLGAAVRAGLRVPRTIVTNDPGHALRFADSVGNVIYKPLAASSFTEDDRRRPIYASVVARDELSDPAITMTSQIFQEWIDHDHAVRLTVVDRRFFACAIYSSSPAADLDWRSDYSALGYGITDPPPRIKEGVSALMNEFGLRFGALDFLVTPGGDWVFLEINPNGQWAWIEEEVGLPIADAIAGALTGRPI